MRSSNVIERYLKRLNGLHNLADQADTLIIMCVH